MKKLTTSQIDNQILDHADEIVRLMKLKGWKDESFTKGICTIDIGVWHDGIQVENIIQEVKTIRRKKK